MKVPASAVNGTDLYIFELDEPKTGRFVYVLAIVSFAITEVEIHFVDYGKKDLH